MSESDKIKSVMVDGKEISQHVLGIDFSNAPPPVDDLYAGGSISPLPSGQAVEMLVTWTGANEEASKIWYAAAKEANRVTYWLNKIARAYHREKVHARKMRKKHKR